MADRAAPSLRERFKPVAVAGHGRRRRLLRATDLRRWPPAVQIVVLSVVLSAALAVGLTWMGYTYASHGLLKEADAAISSDGLVVSDSVDAWNQRRIGDLQIVSAMPAVRRYAQAGPNADPTVKAAAQEILATFASQSGAEVEALSLVGLDGAVLYNSAEGAPAGTLPKGGFVKAAATGAGFTSDIVLSDSGKPALFHAVPVKDDQGKPLAVLQSRSKLTTVDDVVAKVNNRVGPNAFGVLIDKHGVVIANSRDPSWEQRPLTALPKDTADALVADSRWGAHAPPPPLKQSTLAKFVNVSQQTLFSWKLNGTAFHAEAVASHEVPWTYIVALPEADYTAPTQSFLRNAVISAAVALAIAGLLAVVFTRVLMRERRRFQERELQLTRKVAELQVQIDEVRRARDVQQIVESDFFQDLSGKAQKLREHRQRRADAAAAAAPPTE